MPSLRLSVNAAYKRFCEQLGIAPDALRNYVQQVRVDAGATPSRT